MRLLCLVCIWLQIAAAADSRSLPVAKVREIGNLITAEMARQGIPGLTIAVGIRDGVLWSRGFGLADVENNVPATPDTVYRLASLAKPITATAAMRCVEQGKLDLDAPVQKYVPQFPVKPHPLMVRHLLSHFGGIRHYRGEEINSTHYFPTLADALAIFAGDPLLFEPGTHYSYTTYGYVLLGAVLEGAAGQLYLDVVRRHVFEPAHMAQTQEDSWYRIIPHRAHGYLKDSSGELRNCGPADTSYKIPGGGLSSTAADMVRFAVTLQQGKLVRRTTLDTMWTVQRTRDGKGHGYGFGWTVEDWDGRLRVGHTGSQQGTSTILSLLPADHITVAILCNLEGVQWPPLLDGVQRILRKDDSGR